MLLYNWNVGRLSPPASLGNVNERERGTQITVQGAITPNLKRCGAIMIYMIYGMERSAYILESQPITPLHTVGWVRS
jgi:hypothetical protein